MPSFRKSSHVIHDMIWMTMKTCSMRTGGIFWRVCMNTRLALPMRKLFHRAYPQACLIRSVKMHGEGGRSWATEGTK